MTKMLTVQLDGDRSIQDDVYFCLGRSETRAELGGMDSPWSRPDNFHVVKSCQFCRNVTHYCSAPAASCRDCNFRRGPFRTRFTMMKRLLKLASTTISSGSCLCTKSLRKLGSADAIRRLSLAHPHEQRRWHLASQSVDLLLDDPSDLVLLDADDFYQQFDNLQRVLWLVYPISKACSPQRP